MTHDIFGFPLCGFCKDTGLTLDDFNGYRFCTCIAGIARKVSEPKVVEESNAARQKLGLA